MSLCDLCVRPGACCQDFHISATAWKDEGIGGAWRIVQKHGFPFYPLKKAGDSYVDDVSGKIYQTWRFSCAVLLPNGRCGDYENRPTVCREYAPRADGLCVMSGESRQRLLPLLV